MNIEWVKQIKETLEIQEFLNDLIEYGATNQNIQSSDWWLEE